MKAIEIARRMAELGQKEDAKKAYLLALREAQDSEPMVELEAASYIFFAKGDHKIALNTFLSLYNRGFYQKELMELITRAFYLPNIRVQQKQYAANCAQLSKYPYIFRKDFPAFEDLPIQFFPFDEKHFVPFYKKENRFGNFINFNNEIIDRYFFRDLEKPVLAQDIYSQYQLDYLNDTVRKSEWVGRENHIYLHYTDWLTFCAYLQCLDYQEPLKEEKLVILFDEEISQYPIDFKERFGIDYSQYPVKPVGIREVNRMIWHTQLATHNGGDFFNEIFYGHPNLLIFESVMFDVLRDLISNLRGKVKREVRLTDGIDPTWLNNQIRLRLAQVKDPTEKDYFVAIFLSNPDCSRFLDPNSRIVPAIFFQPHFSNVNAKMTINERMDGVICTSNQLEEVYHSPIFRHFKYIKTFTPLRRVTGSYGATVRFMETALVNQEEGKVLADAFAIRLLNRGYLVDRLDRVYRDSVLVRFEDGKLNPKATFTALAEFLDIPYTESMTYCSTSEGKDTLSYATNDRGFDPAAIYRTYDDYVNDADRALLEYFLRDLYELYGYDFHYYKGETVDNDWIEAQLSQITNLDHAIGESHHKVIEKKIKEQKPDLSDEEISKMAQKDITEYLKEIKQNRLKIIAILMKNPPFYSHDDHKLTPMRKLELDPELLEQPLYH